jgi:hypothetical protein
MSEDDGTRPFDRTGGALATEEIADLCRSCASFIAEIDSSSEDVAAYLEQRLGPLLRIAYFARQPAVWKRVGSDGRKLVSPVSTQRQDESGKE